MIVVGVGSTWRRGQTEGRTENEIIAIITNMRTGYTKIDRKGLLNMKEK